MTTSSQINQIVERKNQRQMESRLRRLEKMVQEHSARDALREDAFKALKAYFDANPEIEAVCIEGFTITKEKSK